MGAVSSTFTIVPFVGVTTEGLMKTLVVRVAPANPEISVEEPYCTRVKRTRLTEACSEASAVHTRPQLRVP